MARDGVRLCQWPKLDIDDRLSEERVSYKGHNTGNLDVELKEQHAQVKPNYPKALKAHRSQGCSVVSPPDDLFKRLPAVRKHHARPCKNPVSGPGTGPGWAGTFAFTISILQPTFFSQRRLPALFA